MYELLLALNGVVFVATCVWYAGRRCAGIYHPGTMYLIVHGFIFVFRPVLADAFGYDIVYRLYGFQPTLQDKMITIGITMVTLAVVMVTLVRFAGEPVRMVRTPTDIRRRMRMPVLVVTFTLGLIAAYSAIETINSVAYNTGTMEMTRNGYRINTSGNGYFADAKLMLVPITILVAWVHRFSLPSLIPFAVFVLAFSSTGGRGPFIIAFAALGLVYLYDSGRKVVNGRIVALAAIAFALFAITGQGRGYALREVFAPDQARQYGDNEFNSQVVLSGMDFANMEYVEFVVHTVPKRTQTYGFFLENLQLLTEPVPRKLWPGKPVGSPIKMFDLFDYGHPLGATLTIAGQGWQGLGLPGVVAYAFLAGLFLAAIYRFAMRRMESPFVMIGYMTFLGGLILFLRDGALITIVRTEIFYLAPVVLAYALSGSVPLRIRLLRTLGPEEYGRLIAKVGSARRVPARQDA